MTPRMNDMFDGIRREGRTGLAAYLVAGDPDRSTTLEAMDALVEAGVSMLEIGMPFSDPVADGPVIADAHHRALRGGQTTRGVFELVSRFREHDETTPVTLMGYVNPALNIGVDAFFSGAAESGADGCILVDLPLEHAGPWNASARARGVSLVPLLAPTADRERERRILSSADAFVYMVARTGITGAQAADVAGVRERADRARGEFRTPLASGFGIRTAEQAKAFAGAVDLVVVGSLFVETLARGGSAIMDDLGKTARGLVEALGD